MDGSHRHCTGIQETRLSRGRLFSEGAKGGAALVLAGSLGGSLVGPAVAADTIPDGDLAYARLLVGAELLALDFHGRAIASKRLSGGVLTDLKRARANEREHYQSVSEILRGAEQTPAVAADFDFSYPKGTFGSRQSIAKVGVTLETAFMGAYLGAVEGLQTNALRQLAARIAASEAEHLGVFMRLSGRSPVGVSLPRPLTVDQVSNALDVFAS